MSNKWKPVLFAVSAVIGTFISLSMLIDSFQYFGKVNDLPEFYSASWLTLKGEGAAVYDLVRLGNVQQELFPSLNGRLLGVYLAPPVLLFLAPLSLVPLSAVAPVWFTILLISLILSLFILFRTFRMKWNSLIFLWAIAIIFGPTYEALRLGQLGTVLLLSYTLAITFLKKGHSWSVGGRDGLTGDTSDDVAGTRVDAGSARKWELLSGLALSVLIVKPQLLIPWAVFLLGARRFHVLGSLCGFSLLWLAGSFLLIGGNGLAKYVELMQSIFLTDKSAAAFISNSPTICGQLLRLDFVPANVSLGVGSLISLLLLAVLFIIAARYKNRADWQDACVLTVMPIASLTSVYVQDYDLVLLLPSIALFAVHRMHALLSPFLMLAVVVLNMVLLMPFYGYIRYGMLLKGSLINPFTFALASLVLITSLSTWKHARNPS